MVTNNLVANTLCTAHLVVHTLCAFFMVIQMGSSGPRRISECANHLRHLTCAHNMCITMCAPCRVTNVIIHLLFFFQWCMSLLTNLFIFAGSFAPPSEHGGNRTFQRCLATVQLALGLHDVLPFGLPLVHCELLSLCQGIFHPCSHEACSLCDIVVLFLHRGALQY